MAMREPFGFLAGGRRGGILVLFLMMLMAAGAIPTVWAQGSAGTASRRRVPRGMRGNEPYMNLEQQEPIFDNSANQLSPMQRAAIVLARRAETARIPTLANIKNLVTYTYTLEGDDEAKILDTARLRALMSAAARLYFENYYILGRDLLEPYLRRNGKQFIARTTINQRRILPNNRFSITVTMSVNLDLLYSDLKQKMFIAEPPLVPVGAVLLNATVNGQEGSAFGARQRIEAVLRNNGFVVHSDLLTTATRRSDLASNPDLLYQARMNAERNNIDFIITGTLSLRADTNKQILFDDFAFEQGDVVLRLYRVDSGQVITQITDTYSASGPNEAAAVKNLLDVMMPRITQKLAGDLRNYWNTTMLDKEDYRLMISGVDRSEANQTYDWLRTFAPGMKIFEKSFYGNVAVINIKMPPVVHGNFENFLRTSIVPEFYVHQVSKNHVALEVL